jgi:hypothetical protein
MVFKDYGRKEGNSNSGNVSLENAVIDDKVQLNKKKR